MKIDYEITVDVSNADIETKKRVQDAFFRLGITWAFSSKCYEHLGKALYTNRHDSGEVVNYLTWCYSTRKPTHTIDQLFELAGMKKETKLIPFDLEKALAGDPVITRSGEHVSQMTLFDVDSEYDEQIACVVGGRLAIYHKDGKMDSGIDSRYDLFMKPKTRIVNGFEVPAPESLPLNSGDDYYCADVNSWYFYENYPWSGNDMSMLWLKRGLVFLAKEDAIANAKAMVGIDPYGDEE